jgi:hypothetical protein
VIASGYAVTRNSKAGIAHRRFVGTRRALCGVRVHRTVATLDDRRPCVRCEGFIA